MSKTLLQVNVTCNSGSTGRIADEIGRLAMATGWRSYIAYGRGWPNGSDSNTIRIGSPLSIYLHGFATRLFDRHGFSSKHATKQFVKQIENIKPDVILLHNIHGYYINIKILFQFLAKTNVPVVWTLHDCWAMTGHCAFFNYIGCERWIAGCHHCPQKTSYPTSFFLDRSKRNYALKKKLFTSLANMTIVPVSFWLGGLVKKSFLNKYPVRVIQNGIESAVFSPQTEIDKDTAMRRYNPGNKCLFLGVASIWSKRKGLEDLVALNRIIDRERYKIIIVGLSKDQIRTLPEEITGIARTENAKELATLYSTADMFLNPTWEDTFPTTNLEALACGTPVVTYRTGGSIESVTDDVGRVVEKGDVAGLYRAVQSIHDRGKAFYAQKCRERALALYDKRKAFQKYIELFGELVSATSPA
jgi:glycosyltransferase involved in cell wall biosynthesis